MTSWNQYFPNALRDLEIYFRTNLQVQSSISFSGAKQPLQIPLSVCSSVIIVSDGESIFVEVASWQIMTNFVLVVRGSPPQAQDSAQSIQKLSGTPNLPLESYRVVRYFCAQSIALVSYTAFLDCQLAKGLKHPFNILDRTALKGKRFFKGLQCVRPNLFKKNLNCAN